MIKNKQLPDLENDLQKDICPPNIIPLIKKEINETLNILKNIGKD